MGRAIAQLALELRTDADQPIDRGRGQGAQLGAHQTEVDAVGPLTVADLLRPRLHVGNPLGRERVTAHVAGRRAFIDARRLLQAGEERHHAGRLEAGVAQSLHADPVGLAFGVAREGQHLLHLSPPGHRDDAGHRLRVRARGQRTEHRRRQRHHRGLALGGQHARDVPLGDVADLVRQHRCQFGLALGGHDQAAVHADVTSGQREGVQARVEHQEEFEE
jgi:hypothetical protein